MNKTAIYGLGAVLGLGAAVALFYGTRPSDSGPIAVENTGIVIAPNDVDSPKVERVDKAEKKEPADGEGSVNPFAAKAAELQERDYNQFSAKAAPTWQGIGMELHNSSPELSEQARAMGQMVRSHNKTDDVDVATVLNEQRELLAEIRAVEQTEASQKGIDRLDALMAALESGEEMP
ncbi:MAG: hypothetical protein GY913_08985 [Proteobacteria bacterium]|nr:hypothetical protein [Pseudomonadota bacterium]